MQDIRKPYTHIVSVYDGYFVYLSWDMESPWNCVYRAISTYKNIGVLCVF